MNDLRNEFRNTADRLRLIRRIVPLVFGAFLVGFWLSWWLQSTFLFLVLFALIVAFLIGIVAHALFAPILCPGCQKRLFRSSLDEFCPECGAHALQKPGNRGAPSCTDCGTTFQRGPKNSRQWPIKCCTNCGCRLDDEGL